MDALVRDRIVELRRRGYSYTEIARDTGVGRETIKSARSNHPRRPTPTGGLM